VILPDEQTGESSQARLVPRKQLIAMLYGERQRPGFHSRICQVLAEHLAEELDRLKAYDLADTRSAGQALPESVPRAGQRKNEDGVDVGLFSEEYVEQEAREQARRGPIESWMTYLEPGQLPLVRRNWSGPARISGPAG